MTQEMFVANAFTSGPFTGNPAAVILLERELSAETMQAIAEQNNLSETAFVRNTPDADGLLPLRWFTPAREVRLCGHATLAAGYVLGEVLGFGESLSFSTLSGRLDCVRGGGGGGWTLDFPADGAFVAPDVHDIAQQSLGRELGEYQVYVGTDDAMVVLDSAAEVRDYQPIDTAIARIPKRGLILTAPGDAGGEFDVVSRCFYPEFGILEDPVTGSAHTLLAPYWAKVLGKPTLRCQQASRRRGVLDVHYDGGERVRLTGSAELYLRGVIELGE